MKALIFGSAGMVGRALAVAAPDGTEIVALTKQDCDVTDRSAVRAAIRAARPSLVFNAAAYTDVDRAENEPDRAGILNAAAPGWIAAAARESGARFVHVSTDFVFGGTSGRPYTPASATRPLSVYGRTKRDGEAAALAADSSALIVRTAWVHDAGGSNFVRTILRLIRERDRLTIVGDQLGTPTHALSLARALWVLAARGAAGLHHFTDAGIASRYDFAVAIQEEALPLGLVERPAAIVPVRAADFPAPARRPACAILDKSATWALLDRPPPHWRATLRTCLKEIARNG